MLKLRIAFVTMFAVLASIAVPVVANAQSNPPECIKTILRASGGGPKYYVEFCGAGGGADSPLKDNVNNVGTQLLDGEHITLSCGLTTANRCVFFWEF